VVRVAAPARPTRMTESRADKGKGNKDPSLHEAPPVGIWDRTGRLESRGIGRAAQTGITGRHLVWLVCGVQQVCEFGHE
jgi:hypothetical protein